MTDAHASEGLLAEIAAALAAGDYARVGEIGVMLVPMNERLGLQLVHYDENRVVMTIELSDEVRGAMPGTIHGGVLATFADTACGAALVGNYEMGVDTTVTTDLHVRYYRQPKSGPLTATASIVHRGRRLLSTECQIVDADERVLARATATYMVVPLAR